MKKLIEKHQQSNGRGRGVIQFSPEALQYMQSRLNYVPGMNTNSNTSGQQIVQQIKKDKKVEEEVPKTRAEGSWRNVERRRRTGKTKDQEDTERDIKLATQPTRLSELADALHIAGTGLTTAGGAAAFLSNPITVGSALIGGMVGGRAVDKASQRLTGKTWAENVQNKLGLQTPTLAEFTNPGYFIGGGLGSRVPKGIDYLARMDMPRYGYKPTTKYYFKPGYLGINFGNPIEKVPEVPEGWEIIRPLVINGRNTYQVKHPIYGFSTLDEVNGTYGRGNYAKLFTNEALDEYNPQIRQDPSNNKLIDESRYIARRVDAGKDSPAVIDNTEEYHQYPKIWDILLKTQIGKKEYPNGATIVGRGLWPGSSKIAKSPNYDALFLGYNRDMGMPYMRIGSDLGGKNNFGLPQYEKYFSPEKVKKLREIDKEIENMINTKSYYSQEYADQLYRLHNQRNTLLGDKLPEFGGFQQLLVPNAPNGKMLNTVMPSGLAMEGGTFGDLGAGQPITIPRLAGDQLFYDANSVSSALASEGPARNIYGVFLHSDHPSYTGIHDKGVGSTLIWNQDGFAPFLKSIHGNSLKNLSGTIESAYKKGGKFLKKSK